MYARIFVIIAKSGRKLFYVRKLVSNIFYESLSPEPSFSLELIWQTDQIYRKYYTIVMQFHHTLKYSYSFWDKLYLWKNNTKIIQTI